MTPSPTPDPTSPGTEGEEMRTAIEALARKHIWARWADDYAQIFGFNAAAAEICAGPLARLHSDLTAAREERDTLRERVGKLEEENGRLAQDAQGLRDAISFIGEFQKSCREAEKRHQQWRWDNPIIKGAALSSSDPEKQNG